jgi:hypothetical protein
VRDELVLEEFLDGLEGLATLEVADAGDELSRHVLVVAHSHLDSGQDAHLLAGNEV